MNLYKFSEYVNEGFYQRVKDRAKKDVDENPKYANANKDLLKRYVDIHGNKKINSILAKGAGIAAVGAGVGYGIYKLIKALVNSLKSDETKLKQLESELHTASDKKKVTIKQDIYNLKKKIEAKKKKIVEKKKEASKKHKNESLDFEIDCLLIENKIFISNSYLYESDDEFKPTSKFRKLIALGKTLEEIGINHAEIIIPKEELFNVHNNRLSDWQIAMKKTLKIYNIKSPSQLDDQEFKNFFDIVRKIEKES